MYALLAAVELIVMPWVCWVLNRVGTLYSSSFVFIHLCVVFANCYCLKLVTKKKWDLLFTRDGLEHKVFYILQITTIKIIMK